MTRLNRLQLALSKVPILYPVLKWLRDTWRATWGPGRLNRQVDRRVARGEPIRIIIGAGGVGFEGDWIPTNVQVLNLLVEEQWRRTFSDHGIDAIFAEHVWEHLSPADGRAGAARCFKYLKPGGYLRIAVPDGNHPDPEYIEFVRPGGIGPGADDHKILYTYQTLRDMLHNIGFQVEPLEYYDDNGSFHHADWDPAAGCVIRRQGWTEKRSDGTTMPYTSLIVDARRSDA